MSDPATAARSSGFRRIETILAALSTPMDSCSPWSMASRQRATAWLIVTASMDRPNRLRRVQPAASSLIRPPWLAQDSQVSSSQPSS